jgi:hypothetical protein
MAERKQETGGVSSTTTRRGSPVQAPDGAGNGVHATPAQPAKTGRGGAARSPDLRRDLREFASARPSGWEHEDWLNFLETLQQRGHNVNDRDMIGRALERERLDLALSGVKGVGPQRRQALIEAFGTVWNVRNAEVERIAEVAKVPRTLAEQIKAGMG